MQILKYLACALIGYLIGSSNMAYYIAKIKKVDLYSGGSGNLGTSNAVILIGAKAGIIVFLHDMLKTVLAVVLCKLIFKDAEYAPVIVAVSSVFGHIFPFYLKFKGGKGFASYIGMIIALDWKFGLIMCIGIIAVSIIFDWIVAGTFLTIAVSPVYFLVTANWIVAMLIVSASICIFVKHIPNIKKKIKGEEIGIRTALTKKQ